MQIKYYSVQIDSARAEPMVTFSVADDHVPSVRMKFSADRCSAARDVMCQSKLLSRPGITPLVSVVQTRDGAAT